VPLDQMVSKPLDVAFALRLAIGISRAIDHLHQRGIIHKDIKPANILANSATDQCWLRGFLIASRLPRERQAPEPPEFIAGTLAYVAPEQTGRMNRSIDSRSDLYSLGVTLYEMLRRRPIRWNGSTLPSCMGDSPPHRRIPTRRARLARSASDSREVVRARLGDRYFAWLLRPRRGEWKAGAGTCLRIF
jgi:serine/threonine protein kinase